MANEKANTVPLDATLKLTVLGGASLSYLLPNQELTQVLGAGKPLALLVYLARLPKRTATRDHVLDLLWSNQTPSMAKPALRQAIWYIRQRIGNSGVESGAGMIKLAVRVESDADRFEAAVDDGELERAIGLYDGSFLPDLAIPGGAEFEHWANAERVRLESLFLRTVEVVTRSWLSQGHFQKAEKLARRTRDMNRVKQAWWRLLLEVLTSSGDAVRAAVEAGELERTLASEGLQPDRATSEAIRLARQMLAATAEPASARTLVAELVGRERDFAAIVRTWDEAKTGSGRHLTMTGGAGFGKTRLLTDVHMRLHASGVQIIHLRANVGERQIEYSLASNLAVALSQLPGAKGIPPACAATLVALNPSLSSLYEVAAASIKELDVLRMRTIALCELLEAVAHEGPVAVLIDDLHWIDEASRNVLGGLAGCLQDSPAMMITASRPTARGPLQDSAQQEITLEPLTLEYVFALVSSIGTLPDAEWVRPAVLALRDENGGSPLLVLESLQLAIDRGSLERREGEWYCSNCEALVAEFRQGGALRQRVAKLDRSESWVLLILAVAGMPLSLNQLARMAGRSAQSLSPAVVALEQRGFVARVENELEPAHDEIGALSIELAGSDAGPAASGAVGRILAEDAADNDQLLLRAGQLLAAAADSGRLNDVFRKRLWLARRRGDRRRTGELARELLGDRFTEEKSKALLRGLPLHCRVGLTSARRVAATASVILLACFAGVTAALWPAGLPPDAILVAYDRSRESDGTPLGAPLRWENWNTVPSVDMVGGISAPQIPSPHSAPVPSPDGSRWAFSRLTSDTGEIDVFIVDMEGKERRLTFTPHDDQPTGWSPDGRQLLIVSSRWHPDEFYDGAILDPQSGAVTRLTNTPHSEAALRWSPDGTRIAYARRMLGDAVHEVCWTTPGGDRPVCNRSLLGFLGWRGPTELLVLADSGGVRRLGRLDLVTNEFQTIVATMDYHRVSASRDGKWVTAARTDTVTGKPWWSVFPIDAPDQDRGVEFGDNAREDFHLTFRVNDDHESYLDQLAIERPSTALSIGVPHLLQASGFDVAGRRVPLCVLKWDVSDSSIATIGAHGALRPRRSGRVVVLASAGGWRVDSLTLSVEPPRDEPAFSERWTTDWPTRWDAYGHPKPQLTPGPDSVPGFWNNGDRSFTSGAYSLEEWPADRGLGIEAMVSTTITRPDQQMFALSLAGWIDTARVATWDHREGEMPGRGIAARPHQCVVSYPDNYSVLDGEITLQAGTDSKTINTSLPIHTGQWHRVRLQIFPDGTCGLAINGRAVGRSTTRVPLDTPYRLWTEGRSIGEKMLVGPVEVWTGVRTDVDWETLPWPR